ncbi:hypothetical protein Mal52_21450 [Symmachiella dynata]|uniref:SGNH hydrolase-type esterase domain-containing protein n=1 Tax=Symmachiella dynata TaxID=2527995 RepID=A0A517ZMG1_9PLAN|nr:SGNH/GDSL hydrolase family protein [Symmachiella dynata]QDU43669.1 hypothetical protein Mal52_21450 [Symmachiella dynata]
MLRFFATLVALLALAQCTDAAEPVRERIEWADYWVTDAEKDDLPRVLFIGDSIVKGYFSAAEKQLAGKVRCARLATSKCVADPLFLDEVRLLLKQYRFDVIHFNNGLHGWGYSEDQYRDGLQKFLTALPKEAGDAKIVWATSTPMRASSDLKKFHEKNQRVVARNRLAAEVMKQRGLPTNDLYGLVEPHPDWHSKDGVHFNDRGKTAQGAAVAESVIKQLRDGVTPGKRDDVNDR